MGNAQKLKYLNGFLTGEAAKFIKDVTIRDCNYKTTWESLKKEYYKPRCIIDVHLEKIELLSICQKEVVVDLRKLLETTRHIVNSLKNLDQVVDIWNYWLVYRVMKCLDAHSRELRGTYLKTILRTEDDTAGGETGRLPNFKNIATFLKFASRL